MSPIKVKPGKDPQPPRPTTTTTTTPAPLAQPAKAGTPSGPITTAGFPGVTWEDVTRYDDAIHAAADPVGWPVERVRGHILIESQGKPRAMQNNASNGNSYGLMQVVPYGVGWEGWHKLVKEKAGLPANASKQQVIDALYDPAVNIAVGVTILEGFYQQYGRLDEASSAFFLGNPNWKGEDTVNGNTGSWYRDTLNALIKEQDANGTTPAVTTTPAPKPTLTRQQVADIILGGVQVVSDTFRFNQRNPGQHLYKYGVGHGTDSDESHTGDDLFVPLGTVIHTPLSGVVRCVGSQGQGDWGQGCGSFNDTITGGVGNVTVLTDAGIKITFGHVNKPLVTVGQRVNAGQAVATSGGMFSPHLHLDVTENRNGTYWLLDPIPAIIRAMSSEVPEVYAERLPIPQPAEFDVSATVRATRDGVPVLQRAMLDAAPVREPLKKGEEFEAVYQVIGNDQRIYWVSSLGSRIPVEGTESDEWVA